MFFLSRIYNVLGTLKRGFRHLLGHVTHAIVVLETVVIIVAKAIWKAFIDGLALHATSEAGWSHHVLRDYRKEFEEYPDEETTLPNSHEAGYSPVSPVLLFGEPPAHPKLPPPHRMPPSWIEYDNDDQ